MTSAGRDQLGERAVPPSEPATCRADPEAVRLELKRSLAAALRDAVRAEERRTGRSLDKAVLARQVAVSRNSIYAYLEGRRLPSAAVLDALLVELSVSAEERRRLGNQRDAIADFRQHLGRRLGPGRGDRSAARAPEPGDGEPDAAPPVGDLPVGDLPVGDLPGTDAPDTVPAAPEATGRRGRRFLPRGRKGRVAVIALAVVLVAGAAIGGRLLWLAGQPGVVVRKGASAVGHLGKSGRVCTDPSCAYLVIELRNFKPRHTYMVTCRSNGGMDPLENRNGFYTLRMSTDDEGNSVLADRSSCLWGYQSTQVWVSVQSNDGIPEVASDPVAW